jgi:hypothetical protein
VIPCDVVPVVREHANRHEGSEFASPSPQRWLGPGDRRRGTRIGPTTRPTPKSALLDARLHPSDDAKQIPSESCLQSRPRASESPPQVLVFSGPDDSSPLSVTCHCDSPTDGCAIGRSGAN